MANLKNITDLPVAESADGLNLIVNDNGAAKQIAASAVGAQADFAVTDETSPAFIKNKPEVVKSINGVQPDKNGDVQIDTASSWNDLKDKPFYSIPGVYTPAVITKSDEFSGRIYLDYQLERYKPYVVRVDGVVYSFDALKMGDYSPATGYYSWYLGAKFVLNTSAIQWDYPFTIFSMGKSGPKEPTEIRFEDGTTNHTVEFLGKETVHKLDGKYLPDPFWVEEKKTLVVEGMSDSGNYNVQSQLEVGKEYTYFIDGIKYTGECYKEDTDVTIALEPVGVGNSSTVAYVYEYGISLNNMDFDLSVPHRIERMEKIYHTYHDFMVINETNDDNGESNTKVVAGDFATAKEKILKGLPATAYVSWTRYGDGWYEAGNYIDYDVSYYHEDNGFEVCNLPGFGIGILPDNTID